MLDPAALRKARKALGLTQEALGQIVHRATNTIGRIERGELKPGPQLLASIVKAIGLTDAEDLAPDYPQQQQRQDTPLIAPDLSEDEAEALAAMRRMSPVNRGMVVGFALGLAASDSPSAARAAADLAAEARRAQRDEGSQDAKRAERA